MSETPRSTLRLVVITMGITPVVAPLLNCRHSVVGIIECSPRGHTETRKESALYRFMRGVYSAIRKQPRNLANISRVRNIPYYFMTQSDSAEMVEWIRSLKPDLMVVFSMSRLLKENIYSIPRFGAINLHSSLLPKYRGPNPWVWTYYQMDLHPGVTVHYVDKGEDTGDIIYQEGFDISLGTKLADSYKKAIENIGVRLLLKSIDDIAVGIAPRVPQPAVSPTDRARNISPGEGQDLIDWDHWPIERIWHFINGAEQWLKVLPEMKGIYAAHEWEIGKVEKCSMAGYDTGRVYQDEKLPFLACRDGRILLKKRFRLERLKARLISAAKK